MADWFSAHPGLSLRLPTPMRIAGLDWPRRDAAHVERADQEPHVDIAGGWVPSVLEQKIRPPPAPREDVTDAACVTRTCIQLRGGRARCNVFADGATPPIGVYVK